VKVKITHSYIHTEMKGNVTMTTTLPAGHIMDLSDELAQELIEKQFAREIGPESAEGEPLLPAEVKKRKRKVSE
jgi:hypothetical protein